MGSGAGIRRGGRVVTSAGRRRGSTWCVVRAATRGRSEKCGQPTERRAGSSAGSRRRGGACWEVRAADGDAREGRSAGNRRGRARGGSGAGSRHGDARVEKCGQPTGGRVGSGAGLRRGGRVVTSVGRRRGRARGEYCGQATWRRVVRSAGSRWGRARGEWHIGEWPLECSGH
eukprot:731703-Prorocentrum_minimum.AAC.2